MNTSIDFRALAGTDARLYASLERVREGLENLVSSRSPGAGQLPAEALAVLEQLQPGSREVMRRLAEGVAPEEARTLIDLLAAELGSEVYGPESPA